MRSKKTLSSFSVAAVTLLFAAVPCLAQNQSDESRAEVKSSVTSGVGLETLFTRQTSSVVVRTGFVFAPKNLVDNSRGEVTPPRFSLAISKVMSQINAKENKLAFKLDLRPYNSKSQFQTDLENGTEQPKRSLTFVPSRGPRFPF